MDISAAKEYLYSFYGMARECLHEWLATPSVKIVGNMAYIPYFYNGRLYAIYIPFDTSVLEKSRSKEPLMYKLSDDRYILPPLPGVGVPISSNALGVEYVVKINNITDDEITYYGNDIVD